MASDQNELLSIESGDHGHHPPEVPTLQDLNPQDSLTLGLSLLGGLGVTLMMTAGAIGVIQGEAANNSVLGFMFIGGAAAFVAAAVGWAGVTKPWDNFQSVTEGYYDKLEETSSHGHDDEPPFEREELEADMLNEATPRS
jgi:hypothetical protein